MYKYGSGEVIAQWHIKKEIFCTYYDAYRDVTYRFKSKDLMQEPGYASGDPIKIYVDPKDYSKYVVYVEETVNPRVIDYT